MTKISPPKGGANIKKYSWRKSPKKTAAAGVKSADTDAATVNSKVSAKSGKSKKSGKTVVEVVLEKAKEADSRLVQAETTTTMTTTPTTTPALAAVPEVAMKRGRSLFKLGKFVPQHQEKNTDAVVPEEVEAAVVSPAALEDTTAPIKKGGDAASISSNKKRGYVPLQQRLKEKEAKTKKNAAASRKVKKKKMNRKLSTQLAACGVSPKSPLAAFATVDTSDDSLLPKFEDLDRVCSPMEHECGQAFESTSFEESGGGGGRELLIDSLLVDSLNDNPSIETEYTDNTESDLLIKNHNHDEYQEGKKDDSNDNDDIIIKCKKDEAAAGDTAASLWSRVVVGQAWFSSDAICGPVDKLDQLITNGAVACLSCAAPSMDDEERTAHSDPLLVGTRTNTLNDFMNRDGKNNAVALPAASRVHSWPLTTSMADTNMVKEAAIVSSQREMQRALEEVKQKAAAELKKAKEKAEMKFMAQADELKWMENNLDYESRQNSALNKNMLKLKQDIADARAKQKGMDQDLEKKRTLIAATEKALEEAEAAKEQAAVKVGALEEKTKTGSMQNCDLNSQIAKLKKDIADARIEQQEAARAADEARQANEKAMTQIQARNGDLKIMETNWKTESQAKDALKSEMMQLQTDISDATAKQEALKEEARQAKDTAAKQIIAQLDALKDMESKLGLESKENIYLKAEIGKLKKEIDNATVKQETVDEKAQRIKKQAELGIKAQTEDLQRMELALKTESKKNDALEVETEQLKEQISETRAAKQEWTKAKTVEEGDHVRAKQKAEKKIKALTDHLNTQEKKNDALKSQMAQLENGVSVARGEAQKTIDSQHEEMLRMEQAISALKADIENEKGLKDKALTSTNDEDSALQTKIDLLSQEIATLKEKHVEQVKVVESLSAAEEEEAPSEFPAVAVEGIKPRAKVLELETNSIIASTVASTTASKGGKKVGWFRKLMTGGSLAVDDESVLTTDTSLKKGFLRLRSRSLHNRGKRSSALDPLDTLESYEEEDDDDGESDNEDDGTYQTASYSATYSKISTYSESPGGTFESNVDAKEVQKTYSSGCESECTPSSVKETKKKSSKKPKKKRNKGGSDNGWFQSIEETPSYGSADTDGSSSSETLGNSTASSNKGATGGFANWFGYGRSEEQEEVAQEVVLCDVVLDRVNSRTVLVL